MIACTYLVSQLFLHLSDAIRVVCFLLSRKLIAIVVGLNLLLLLVKAELFHASRDRKAILERRLNLLATLHGRVDDTLALELLIVLYVWVFQHLKPTANVWLASILRSIWERAQSRLLAPFAITSCLIADIRMLIDIRV